MRTPGNKSKKYYNPFVLFYHLDYRFIQYQAFQLEKSDGSNSKAITTLVRYSNTWSVVIEGFPGSCKPVTLNRKRSQVYYFF